MMLKNEKILQPYLCKLYKQIRTASAIGHKIQTTFDNMRALLFCPYQLIGKHDPAKWIISKYYGPIKHSISE